MADAAVEEALRAHEPPAPEPGPTFDGENKFQHAISVWRSKTKPLSDGRRPWGCAC
jgi:homeobox protein cut-like